MLHVHYAEVAHIKWFLKACLLTADELIMEGHMQEQLEQPCQGLKSPRPPALRNAESFIDSFISYYFLRL